MTLSVRLDPETERLVARLAKARGVSRSEVVRSALTLLGKEASPAGGPTLFDRIGDLIGSASGLPADLSERTGEVFRRRLAKRRP